MSYSDAKMEEAMASRPSGGQRARRNYDSACPKARRGEPCTGLECRRHLLILERDARGPLLLHDVSMDKVWVWRRAAYTDKHTLTFELEGEQLRLEF